MDNKISFEALEKLNMPAIPENIETEPVDTEANVLQENQVEEAQASAIAEVESMEDFTSAIESAEEEPETSTESRNQPEEEEFESSDTGSQNTDDISVIRGIAEYAKSKGLINYSDEDFQDSEEWFESKLVEKSKEYSKEWVENLPPVIQEIIENYEDGVPLDVLIDSKSREIEYSNLDESKISDDVDLQKTIVEEYLAIQGYDEAEIQSKIKKYEDVLILEDEAKTSLKKLRAYEAKFQEQLKQRAIQERAAQEEQINQLYQKIENDILSADELIPGIKLDKDERKKVFEAYTKKDARGETALTKAIKTDPQAWYKITQFMVLMNGNLNNVEKLLKKQVASEVKKSVNTYRETPGLSKLTSPAALKAMKKAIEKAKKS